MHLIALGHWWGPCCRRSVVPNYTGIKAGCAFSTPGSTGWPSPERRCVLKPVSHLISKRIMPLLVRQGWIVTERHLFKNKVTPSSG